MGKIQVLEKEIKSIMEINELLESLNYNLAMRRLKPIDKKELKQLTLLNNRKK